MRKMLSSAKLSLAPQPFLKLHGGRELHIHHVTAVLVKLLQWQVSTPSPSNTFFLHTIYIQVFVPAWSYSGEMVDLLLLLLLQLLFICLAAVVVVLSHFFHCWTTSRSMQTLYFAFLAQARHIRFNRENDRQEEGVWEAKWLNPGSLNANVCYTNLKNLTDLLLRKAKGFVETLGPNGAMPCNACVFFIAFCTHANLSDNFGLCTATFQS